jgi:hypothetical protein
VHSVNTNSNPASAKLLREGCHGAAAYLQRSATVVRQSVEEEVAGGAFSEVCVVTNEFQRAQMAARNSTAQLRKPRHLRAKKFKCRCENECELI